MFHHSLNDWFIDLLIFYSLSYWWIGLLIFGFIILLVYRDFYLLAYCFLACWSIDFLMYSMSIQSFMMCWLMELLIFRFVHSLTYLLIYPWSCWFFIHGFVDIYSYGFPFLFLGWFMEVLIYRFIGILVHWFVDSLLRFLIHYPGIKLTQGKRMNWNEATKYNLVVRFYSLTNKLEIYGGFPYTHCSQARVAV